MKKALGFLASLIVVIIALGIWAWNSETAQDWVLEKAVTVQMARPSSMNSYEGLKVFLCGTSSPIPAPGRAQACVAVLAGESLYLVDVGAGSAESLTKLPLGFNSTH